MSSIDRDIYRQDKLRIKEAFDQFDQDNKGVVSRSDVGTIIRYQGAFPSEEELTSDIMPQLLTSEDAVNVAYPMFESFLLKVRLQNQYEPDSEDILLQAFRALDTEGRNYMEDAALQEILQEGANGFSEKELEAFFAVAKDSQAELVHYEDYIHMAIGQIEQVLPK